MLVSLLFLPEGALKLSNGVLINIMDDCEPLIHTEDLQHQELCRLNFELTMSAANSVTAH